MPSPTICTVPDDIPLHPDAPSIANQGPEIGHCVMTSTFALIAENQRVMKAKARSASKNETKRDHGKSNLTTIPIAQPVYHPRSKMARRIWAPKVTEKIDDERVQDATFMAQVAHHDCTYENSESTASDATSEQLSPLAMDENTNVSDKAATSSRNASMPPIPIISTALLTRPSPRIELPEEEAVAGSAAVKTASSVTGVASALLPAEMPATPSTVSSQDSVLCNRDERPHHGTAEDSRAGSMAGRWRMIRPAPVATEQTVLQPVSASVLSSVGMLDNKFKKVLPGKENEHAATVSESVSAAPSRRSQRILKRKRGDNDVV